MLTQFLNNFGEKTFRRGLILYSIVILAGLFFVQAALLFNQPAQGVVVNTGVSCSGAARSGGECNGRIGRNPIEGHMWGCYDFDNNGAFTCYEVPANSIQGGLPGCFLDSDGVWKGCGCDFNSCTNACLSTFAGQPGHHTFTSTCSACGQSFTCGCDISPTTTPTNTPTNPPTNTPTPSPTVPVFRNECANIRTTASRINNGTQIHIVCENYDGSNPGPWRGGVANGQILGGSSNHFWANALYTSTSFQFGGWTFNVNANQAYTASCYAVIGNGNEAGDFYIAHCPTYFPAQQVTPTPTPTTVAPYCGNGICDAGEYCEVNYNMTGNPSRVCTTVGAPPTGASASYCRFPGSSLGAPYCALINTPTPTPTVSNSPSIVPSVSITPSVSPTPTVTITPTPTGRITLDKEVVSGNSPYDIGDEVQFRIRIQNTGSTVISNLSFRDEYNNVRLDFLRAENMANGANITSRFNVNENLGLITANDLTDIFGDIQPNQLVRVKFYFRALRATNTTCNDVFVIPNGGSQMSDRACISILLPPVTDL